MFGKGALSLLNDYGGDSSDDDVPGPRVSTKRTFKEEDDRSNFKRKLPVPEVLLKSISKPTEEHIDDPVLHGGRVRSFAHERGNWATFVYISLDHTDGVKDLIGEIMCTASHLHLNPVENFHISLTKTVILRHHWITSFVDSIRLRTSYINKFMILFGNLRIYCNEEHTRTFVGLEIKSGYDTLVKLVEIMDTCLEEFKLPSFYDDPSFHMSIAWCVGDFEEELNLILPQMNAKLQDLMESHNQENWYIYVNFLMCKTGNKFFKFDLT